MSVSEAATPNCKANACDQDCECDCGCDCAQPLDVDTCSLRKSDSQEGTWSSTGYNYINPFVHKLRIDDTFDLAKIYMLSVFLLPFRAVGCVVSLLMAWVFACIALHGMTLDDLKEKPLTGWRRSIQKAVAFSMRMVYAAGSFHYVKFIGEQASPKEAPILVVAPHSSYVDSILVVVTGPPSIVAKQETSDIPLLGRIINCSQPIYVLREDPNSRQNTIKEIISRAQSHDNWPQVVIFTEGTCTNRSALIKFKPGAFYPGVPVQPVLLRYPSKYDTYTWTWDGPGVIKLLWLTMTKLYSRCEIEFLPVYTPSAAEKADAKLFADNVREVMAKALGVPTSDYSFEDCIMMNRAREMKIPFPGDIVEIERSLHGLGLLQSNKDKELTAKYCSLADDDVDMVTLADLLNIDLNNKLFHQLFAVLDHQRCGTVSLKSYLLCSFYCKISNDGIIEFLRCITNLYTPSSQSVSRECFYKIVRHSAKLTQQKSDALFLSIDHTNKGTISFVPWDNTALGGTHDVLVFMMHKDASARLDDFEKYTRDNPKYSFLFKKQEHIRRAWK